MPEMQAYGPAKPRYETFSYLPPMTPERIAKQVAYLINQGWTPAIEHCEPERAQSTYWYMWKLPMFGVYSVEKVLAEVEACHRANPGHLVRLVGYDNFSQSQGTAFVVYRGGR